MQAIVLEKRVDVLDVEGLDLAVVLENGDEPLEDFRVEVVLIEHVLDYLLLADQIVDVLLVERKQFDFLLQYLLELLKRSQLGFK